MSEHPGLLGVLSETLELQQTRGYSWDEALQVQRQLAAERVAEYEAAQAESNVIPFRRKH